MPRYEYVCDECGVPEEVVKPIAAFDREEKCPECASTMRRLPVATGRPIFKGTGFYETDYKRRGK